MTEDRNAVKFRQIGVKHAVKFRQIVFDPENMTNGELSEHLDRFKAKAGRFGISWAEAVMVHMLLHEKKKKREEEEDYALEDPEVMTDIKPCPFCGTFLDGGRGGKTLKHPHNGCIIEDMMFSDDLLPDWESRGEVFREETI